MTTPDDKEAAVLKRNRRSDAMFVCAYFMVAWLVYLVVFVDHISEYAQGVLTLALGNFLGWLSGMYNFETGTTRGAQAKDVTIGDIAKAAAPSINNAKESP